MMQKKNNEFDLLINILTSKDNEISKRMIKINHREICILYIKQLTDRIMLSDYIIKPIINYSSENGLFSIEDVINEIIYVDDFKIQADQSKIMEHILSGMAVVLFSWEQSYLVINTKKVEKKAVESPEITYTLRGPKDCFNENLDVNLSLIRYRIKDPELKIQTVELGKRTRARVAVVYINDIVNDSIINDVMQRLNDINTDGFVESGELQSYLLNSQFNLLPQMGLVERSDMACGAMLEGKVVILIEGSGIALVAPKTFSEFFQSSDDIYDNMFFGAFMKGLRLVALLLSVLAGSVYIALVSFHTDILPAEYVITLATLTANVPFNAVTDVILLEIIVEILREALIRIPKQIGGAIGIVGAIIIGEAAISSGIFSPFLLILLSLELLSSFVAPDYSIMNAFRILKFLMIGLTATFGFIGFSLGLCFMITNIISANSFGVAYLAPIAPFNLKDYIKTFFYRMNCQVKCATSYRNT